ncbi:MAG TPA: hypothetical protein VHQ99_00970 [Gaiellaceae bacterium]|nr:hypothetical protein [Gaiellaceae bacterium]
MARRSARKAAGSGPPRRSEPARPVQRRRRPPGLGLIVVTALVVAAGAAGGLLLTRSAPPPHQAASAHGKTIDWSSVPHLQTSAPPWPSESGYLAQRLPSSGLDALSMEGTVLHRHEHLDVFVNGQRVTVPALVGIGTGFLTELHTLDPSGLIHVESPVQRSFALGQFFCEWGIKLNASCLGRYRGELAWWVNGRRMDGNPALLPLRQHQEIVIAAGRPPTTVPASYDFPPGL